MKDRIIQTLSNKYFFISIAILYPIAFIFQCGDLTDTGFFANEFFFLEENLASQHVRSTILLTVLLGHKWMLWFGPLGLIALKILHLIFLYVIIYFSYLSSQYFLQSNWLRHLSILCGLIFATRITNFIFDYDIASYAMLSAGFYFLVSGLHKKNLYFLMYSGIFVGLATLFRFPSLLSIFPFLAIVLFEQNNVLQFRLPKSLHWKNSIYFSLGLILILSLSFFVTLYLNLDQTILKGFSSINKSVSGQDESSHGLYKLLYKYLSDCVKFTPHFILGMLILFLSRWSFKNKITPLLFFFSLGVFIFFKYGLFSRHDYESNLKFLPIIVMGFIFITTKNLFKNASILLLFGILLTQVAGSNTGLFLKLSYGMILSLPVFIGQFVSGENKWILPMHRNKFSMYNLLLILALSFISRWCWIYHVDDSYNARIGMHHSMQSPKLKGIFTNDNRSRYIDDMMGILNTEYLADKDLLVTNNEVLFYYLTNKPPLTVDFWLSNYTTDKIILDEITENHQKQTLVVVEEIAGSMENVSNQLMQSLKAKFKYRVIRRFDTNQIIELYLHDSK